MGFWNIVVSEGGGCFKRQGLGIRRMRPGSFGLLFHKRQSVPIPSLKNDLVVFYPKETTAPESLWVAPFEDTDIPVFEDVFYDTNHFVFGEFFAEHGTNGFSPFKFPGGKLVIDTIGMIKGGKAIEIIVVEEVNPALEELFGGQGILVVNC